MIAPKVIDKTYYRCTKSRGNCSQKYIEAQELERQIKAKIQTIKIPQDFADWAKKKVSSLHEEESIDQQKIIDKLHIKHKRYLKQIDNYIVMRAKEMITEEEFIRMKGQAESATKTLQAEIKAINRRALGWSDVINNYITFAEHAAEKFENGDDEMKKNILQALSSNLTLKDKKLCIYLPKPLLEIENVKSALSPQNMTFEPGNTVENKGFFDGLEPSNLTGWTWLDKLRTKILRFTDEEFFEYESLSYLIKKWS